MSKLLNLGSIFHSKSLTANKTCFFFGLFSFVKILIFLALNEYMRSFFTSGVALSISLSNICQAWDLTRCLKKIHELNADTNKHPIRVLMNRVPIVSIKSHCK